MPVKCRLGLHCKVLHTWEGGGERGARIHLKSAVLQQILTIQFLCLALKAIRKFKKTTTTTKQNKTKR